MKCHDCDFLIKACMGLCDARCLKVNEVIDSLQLKTLVSGIHKKENIKRMNIFFQNHASKMIKELTKDEDPELMSVCVAVYYDVLHPRLRAKLESLDPKHPAKRMMTMIKNGTRPDVASVLSGLKVSV